ncbi:hypothetical protein [Janthinobacterium sp. MDT1-19]|uniref:hypothetical protein n=1 Tax=Janthinobacterium sp. MDT1-19 TaxID=1259339 RepID=UPI003F230BE4
MSPWAGAWPPAWPSSSAALDRQLQHVAAAGAHGAGQLVDGATRFVNAAAARRGRSRATSARQRRPALQVDTFHRLDAPGPPAAAGRACGADLVRVPAHRPARQLASTVEITKRSMGALWIKQYATI